MGRERDLSADELRTFGRGVASCWELAAVGLAVCVGYDVIGHWIGGGVVCWTTPPEEGLEGHILFGFNICGGFVLLLLCALDAGKELHFKGGYIVSRAIRAVLFLINLRASSGLVRG